MLLLETVNDFKVFSAIPKMNGWVLMLDIRFPDDYRWVSPRMRLHLGHEDNGQPRFRDMLASMRVFKSAEKQIVEEGYIGWIAFTTVDNGSMVKLLSTLGGEPYKVDENCNVWFCRGKEDILHKNNKLEVN